MKNRRLGVSLVGMLAVLLFITGLTIFGSLNNTLHRPSTEKVAVTKKTTKNPAPVVNEPTAEPTEPMESEGEEYEGEPLTDAELKAEAESYRRDYPEQAAEQDFRDSLNSSMAKLNAIAKEDEAVLAAKAKAASANQRLPFTPQGSTTMKGRWGRDWLLIKSLASIGYWEFAFKSDGSFTKTGPLAKDKQGRPMERELEGGFYRLDGNKLRVAYTWGMFDGIRRDTVVASYQFELFQVDGVNEFRDGPFPFFPYHWDYKTSHYKTEDGREIPFLPDGSLDLSKAR